MSFLTILFALLGFTVEFQPYTSTVPQGGAQTEMGGAIEVGGAQGDTQSDQGGAIEVGGAQGGTQTEMGGMIEVGG